MADIYEILSERGFVHDCTDVAEFRKLAGEKSLRVYCGFDPTADSLTIGNMVCLMALRHFQLAGHVPIVLMGGATGMIGDPSGKSAERNLQTREQVAANMAAQRRQFELFLEFDGARQAKIVNNDDWFRSITFIEFLRDVGKHFRIGEMLGKESVRARIDSEAGISFTEFSYMLLQAEDFRHLLATEGCQVQVGGADQWGNIVAGIELIRKTRREPAFGLTFKLITTASGEKLGKTAAGAVYLSTAKTSVYEFFQYWMRVEDRDVERFLKLFTFLPLDEIARIVAEHETDPSRRNGQRRLAVEVTTLVHGADEARKAKEAAEALFGGSLKSLTDAKLRELFPDVPSVSIARAELDAGMPVVDLFIRAGLAASKNEARQKHREGAMYLNNETIPQTKTSVGAADLASDSMLILRLGKKKYCLVRAE